MSEKNTNSYILTLAILGNAILSFMGFWWHFFLHGTFDSIFFNADIFPLILTSMAINIFDVMNLALIKNPRYRPIAVPINTLLIFLGAYFMIVYAINPFGLSELPLIMILFVDFIISLIALESAGNSVECSHKTSAKGIRNKIENK